MYDAHIICRFSDKDGAKIPLEHQQSRCLDVAQELGCRLDRVKIIANDNLSSALTWDERADLRELESDITAGSCKSVIVYSIDNLTSNAEVAERLFKLLTGGRIKLYLAQVIDVEETLEPQLRGRITVSAKVNFKNTKILRGFPPEWCFSGRGSEQRIAISLAKWAKKEYPQSKSFVTVRGIVRENTVQWLSPDIDVLVVTQDEVIAHEVKLLEGKKTGIPAVVDVDTGLVMKELKTVRLIDRAIYDGLGKAVFNCLNSDKSYLVVPSAIITDELSTIAKLLPIGLMAFEKAGNFSFVKRCSPMTMRMSQLRDQIFKLAQEDKKGRRGRHSFCGRLIFSRSF